MSDVKNKNIFKCVVCKKTFESGINYDPDDEELIHCQECPYPYDYLSKD